jgi:site-specific recombinase XerD
VRGSKESANVALAQLRLSVDRSEVVIAKKHRSVAAACEMYLAEVRTESQTIRTDRSACRRFYGSVLPGGQPFSELSLAQLEWRRVEEVYVTWSGHLGPTTQARYASTLSKVLEHAKRCGWVLGNVAAQVNRPKVLGHKPEVPIAGEVQTPWIEHVWLTSRCMPT